MTRSPSRDDTETMTCPVCRHPFTPTGRQQYCGDRCRKTAYRRRHHNQPGPVTVPAARPRREHTVYECPACEQRLLGEQRCPDCRIFARRIGTGEPCPHCSEPVAIADLLQEVAIMPATANLGNDSLSAQPTGEFQRSALGNSQDRRQPCCTGSGGCGSAGRSATTSTKHS